MRLLFGLGLAAAVVACGSSGTDPTATGDNAAPVAVDDALTVEVGGSVTFDPTANDTDDDGDALVLDGTDDPEQGTVTVVDATTLTYTAPDGFTGIDRFEYTISDGGGNTATARVTVTVQDVPGGDLALSITAPEDGAIIEAGPLTVEVLVDGCALGESCRIVGDLDGEPVSADSASFVVDNPNDGEHTLSLSLVAMDDSPLDPAVDATVRWTTTGGLDPDAFQGDIAFSDATTMQGFCAGGFVSIDGDVVIDTATTSDTSGLACLERIRGSLTVRNSTLVTLSLPALSRVEGVVSVADNPFLETVELPALRTTGSTIDILTNWVLSDLDLSGLEQPGGTLAIVQSGIDTSVNLDGLRSVDGDLRFYWSGVRTIDLPELVNVTGAFNISSNNDLGSVQAAKLEEVGTLMFGFTELDTVDLPALESVVDRLEITATSATDVSMPALLTVGENLWVDDNELLVRFSAPSLVSVGGIVDFDRDDVLTTIELGSLTTASQVIVEYNPLLTALTLPLTDVDDLSIVGDQLGPVDLSTLTRAGSIRVLRAGDLDLSGLVTVDDDLEVSRVSTLDLSSLERVTDLASLFDTGDTLALDQLQQAGRLTISECDATRIELPALQTIDGSLELRTIPLATEVSLPALTSVGDTIRIISANELLEFEPPALTTGAVSISGAEQFTTVSVPLVSNLYLYLSGLPDLETIDVPAMTSGGLSLVGTGLGDVAFSGLGVLEFLEIRDNRRLLSLAIGATEIWNSSISDNPVLTDLALDVPTLGELFLARNATLTTLDLSSVTSLANGTNSQAVNIASNDQLELVDLSNLVDAATIDLRFNDNPMLTTVLLDSYEMGKGLEMGDLPITTLSLPSMQQADELRIDLADLVTLELPALEDASFLTFQNCGLTTIDLPALQTVQTLRLRDNDLLETLSLPALDTITGDLDVTFNPALTAIAMPALTGTGALEVGWNDGLVELSAPLMTQSESILIERNGDLETLDFGSLSSIGRPATFPSGDLVIQFNSSLSTLAGFPVLTEVADELAIRGNSSLSTAEAQALADALTVGGTVTVAGPLP